MFFVKSNSKKFIFHIFLIALFFSCKTSKRVAEIKPELLGKILLSDGWKFYKYEGKPDQLFYEIRPSIIDSNDSKVADSRPTEAIKVKENEGLKKWILPTANSYILDPLAHHLRPVGNPGGDFPFVQKDYDDSQWKNVSVPHDWAIGGPFYVGAKPEVGGGMGRLPSHGVGWYRRKLDLSNTKPSSKVFIDIDGAMSYSMVWINGYLVGGWPYGYNSYRLDITQYITRNGDNQLAIRLDNPNYSARWYPGGGLYRNVSLVIDDQVHIPKWGIKITTPSINKDNAKVQLSINIKNDSDVPQDIKVSTTIFYNGLPFKDKIIKKIATHQINKRTLNPTSDNVIIDSFIINQPHLWGVPPTQQPHTYTAKIQLYNSKGKLINEYAETFGIREVVFDPINGLILNGEKIRIQGVNQHHDLGAIGAAFNVSAAKRQLDILREAGCNAIRTAHNPPAPELLNLTDKMGFLVLDEIFDSWEAKKTPHDFHLIFPEWHEADVRSFIRRDRNHPSIIAWSIGNEVGEQYTDQAGAKIAKRLVSIAKEEDSSRPVGNAMNYAKPHMPLPVEMDYIGLNYQGEGIRDAPAYAHLKGIKTAPQYPAFQKAFPDKMIISLETASALSTRGSYIFPVHSGLSAPVSDSTGGDPIAKEVSAYELYSAAFGSSADKVFASQDKHPFVAGEFVWTGWDYLGEPTPYYDARSSYSGFIDLAGFKKDRFYLYQARWRPELAMVHILPHWTWPERVGLVTPIHVFTSGDAAELFINGKSQGKKIKGQYESRLRWDDVIYHPGEVKVIAYKNNKLWAENSIKTAGPAHSLKVSIDKAHVSKNDLVFVTVEVIDKEGNLVPDATNLVKFNVDTGGMIVATDNGNPADMTSFHNHYRNSYHGRALGIIKPTIERNNISINVSSDGLINATVIVKKI
jgi:beta-galactosidase